MAKKYCIIQNKAIIDLDEVAIVVACKTPIGSVPVFCLDILHRSGKKATVCFDTKQEQFIAFNNILHQCIKLEDNE